MGPQGVEPQSPAFQTGALTGSARVPYQPILLLLSRVYRHSSNAASNRATSSVFIVAVVGLEPTV